MEKEGKMKLRIIKNRPKFLPGGNIQDVTQQATLTSNPYDMSQNPMLQSYLPNSTMWWEEDSTVEDVIRPTGLMTPDPNIMGGYQNNVVPETKISQQAYDQLYSDAYNKMMNAGMPDTDTTKRSQDGNPLDPMTMPYYAPDLGGRARMLGESIGRIGTAQTKGAKGLAAAEAIFSGISLGMGAAREIAGASSAINAAQKDELAAREKLAKERRQQFIRWEQDGGDVNLGNGRKFDTSSLTGEYIYPLPKSMEDNANVEIEKGEYVLTPDITGPMEAKGSRHENGGTAVDLPDAHIVSDYRKIGNDFASLVRERYGIKAGPDDTYAKLLDRYKKKIGLSDKYEDQEKVYNRLKKNQDVKDKNTSDLNKSILSKYVSQNQEEIDGLESEFRTFADFVYQEQELSKRRENMDAFFRDGGVVSESVVKKQAKAFGVSEDKVKDWIYDEYIKQSRKMAEGGPTKKQIEDAKKLQQIIQRQFGRKLNMSVIDVLGRGEVLNPESDVNANQDLQRRTNLGYGRVNEQSLSNLLDVNRWASAYNQNGDFNVEGFQTGYNTQLNNLWALADAGVISNADAAKAFRDQYGFWGEDSRAYDQGNKSAYNSFAVDNKFGQTTATRSYYGLDVVTPEQKKALNEKGIKNYVDLFGDKSADAKRILGSDYDKFVAIRDSGINPELDFVLEQAASMPADPEPQVLTPTPDMIDTNIELISPDLPATVSDTQTAVSTPVVVDTTDRTGSDRRGTGANRFTPIFPEVLRSMDSGLVIEGMERHQAPRIDPVLQSADQYINELNRATSAQLDAVGDVPDSQRAAILANMNAIAGSNIAKYINQVNLYNAGQISEADKFNELAYVQTDDKNIAERQRYEAGLLKAMAIRDENLARYYDSINSEIQNKFNVQTSLNTIASIAPNMRMLPDGTILYTQGNQDVLNVGDISTPYLMKMNEDSKTKTKKTK